MMVYEGLKDIPKIQKFRRFVRYCVLLLHCHLELCLHQQHSKPIFYREDQYYAADPAGTELLGDSDNLYQAALGIALKRKSGVPSSSASCPSTSGTQKKAPYAYHAQYVVHLLSLGQLDGSG
ncbi:hypothetical protein ACJRO7_012124 [Eucalyptus globulus]|uniref:Uncharacterized protein n=1 Tax=Eucalyptus globulus TaxID=34317 RepID=A0ABD3LHN2_EUCGL